MNRTLATLLATVALPSLTQAAIVIQMEQSGENVSLSMSGTIVMPSAPTSHPTGYASPLNFSTALWDFFPESTNIFGTSPAAIYIDAFTASVVNDFVTFDTNVSGTDSLAVFGTARALHEGRVGTESFAIVIGGDNLKLSLPSAYVIDQGDGSHTVDLAGAQLNITFDDASLADFGTSTPGSSTLLWQGIDPNNQIILSVIPEPTTTALLALSSLVLLHRRRK